MNDILDVGCFVLVTMTPELQKQREYMAIDVILQSLSDNFKQFILNFNMNEIDKILPQLLGILRVMENPNPKKKDALKSEGGISKEGKCFHCDKHGHLKKKLPSLS
ncbi:hypothetical protein GQ457_15G016400 [Hibiscus cannabinus]